MKTYISNYKLKTTKINKTRIVLISDIHYHSTFDIRKFKIILDNIKSLRPNYICITGDLIDNSKVFNDELSYKIFIDFIKNLGKITKVIITLGNHEIESKNYKINEHNELIGKYKNIDNVTILNNEIYVENNIKFIGYNPTYEYYKSKGKKFNLLVEDFNKKDFEIDDSFYNILLIHTPKDLLEDKIYNKINNFNKIDLILSGHMHGGLIPDTFSGNYGLISPGKRLFPKNVRGYLTKANTHLIISSGITKLSYSSHIFRHFNGLYKMNIVKIDIDSIP